LSGDNPETKNKIIRYFKLAMPFVYAGFGLSLVFTNAASALIPSNRIIIGSVFVTYSAYRIYLILKPTKNKDV